MSLRVARVVPNDTLALTEVEYTRPVYLVKIDFPGGTQYMSTGPQISHNGNTYVEALVSVGEFTFSPDGTQIGSIELFNEDNSAVALVLGNGGVNDVACTIYKTYLQSNDTATTPVLFAVGVLDSPSISDSSVICQVVEARANVEYYPSKYYTKAAGFNHLPVPGTVVDWGGERFVLESE